MSSNCRCIATSCFRSSSTSMSLVGGSGGGAAPRPNSSDVRRLFVGRSVGVDSGSSGICCDIGDGGGHVEGSPLDKLVKRKAESETEEMRRWLWFVRPAEEPVNGVKDARLDEGGPLSDACTGGGLDRSRVRLEATLSRFSV